MPAEMVRRSGLLVVLGWRSSPLPILTLAAVAVVGGLLPAAAAWLTKLVIDGLAGAPAIAVSFWALAAALGTIGLIGAALPHLRTYMETELERRLDRRTQDELYSAVNRFSGLARFENPTFLDRLRMADQGSRSIATTIMGMFSLGQNGVTLVSMVGTLAVLNPVMVAAVMATTIPAVLAQLALSRRRARLAAATTQTLRRRVFYSDLLTEAQSAKEVRLLGLGAFLQGRMRTELSSVHDRERKLDRREFRTQILLAALAAGVAGAGLFWVVDAVSAGTLTVGDLSVFVAAVASVQGSLTSIVDLIARTHHELLLFGHYLAVVQAPDDLPSPARVVDLHPLRSGIEFRDVWFRYTDDHPWVLRAVNLTIPHGRSVALIGRNGAGKSTLVKLLCRFYDPTRGAVLWDGVDIRDIPVAELRRRIGAVFQDYMCYDLTAADNIGVGELEHLADQEHVVAAARLAGIDTTIRRLPNGYRTLLSRTFFVDSDTDDASADTGVVLSGGQWQRVALARAFMRGGRDLMILDEPSAGLDAVAEHEVHERLRHHRAGRTSLLISHRLGAVHDADLLVVLSNGSITERGTHQELLAAGGEYARLFTLQAAGYATIAPDGDSRPDSAQPSGSPGVAGSEPSNRDTQQLVPRNQTEVPRVDARRVVAENGEIPIRNGTNRGDRSANSVRNRLSGDRRRPLDVPDTAVHPAINGQSIPPARLGIRGLDDHDIAGAHRGQRGAPDDHPITGPVGGEHAQPAHRHHDPPSPSPRGQPADDADRARGNTDGNSRPC